MLTFLRPFRTPCRHCFPRFAQRFARSFVPVLDRQMLVEIPHRSLFILGLKALISKIPIHLRRWKAYKSTLNHLMCMPFMDVALVANAARNYEILHERDDDDAERPDKRRGGGDNHPSSNNNYSGNNNRLNFKSIRLSSTHKYDPNITVFSSPRVPLRANPTRFALRVDADTQESVVELLVPASSVVKLAICRRIARRTPLRVHLVRLIRSQVH
nr:hypothetical protein [Tanacetum cinerariifolium]